MSDQRLLISAQDYRHQLSPLLTETDHAHPRTSLSNSFLILVSILLIRVTNVSDHFYWKSARHVGLPVLGLCICHAHTLFSHVYATPTTWSPYHAHNLVLMYMGHVHYSPRGYATPTMLSSCGYTLRLVLLADTNLAIEEF